MRNRVIHSYDNVNEELIWGVVVKHLSELKKETSNYYRVADRIGKKGWLSYSEKKVFWDN